MLLGSNMADTTAISLESFHTWTDSGSLFFEAFINGLSGMNNECKICMQF